MAKTFVAAVREKYEYTKEEPGGDLVGGEKTGRQQALETLTRVYVGELGISDPGADGEVAAVCSAIEELDLEANALASWEPVLTITSQLPKLHWLGLNRLPLAPLPELPAGFGAAVGRLRSLCLSDTGMTWDQLLLLVSAMPKLVELHFNSNGLTTTVPINGGALPLEQLETLFLEGNRLSQWGAVAPLAGLPNLQVLNLNYNALNALPTTPGGFEMLRQLMCRGNPIDSWASIDALNQFPALSEARIAEIPLTEGVSGAVSRRLIIGRAGRLKVLNGSEVRPREREDAERFYLRQIAQEYPGDGLPPDALTERDDGTPPTLTVPAGEAWQALQAAHPRWSMLLAHHGTHVTASTGEKNTGGVIANELVDITLRATAAEAAMLPSCSRKLPGGLPLKSVKLIACQLFKVEPTKQQLLYSPPGQEKDIPEVLDDDSRSLCDLGVVSEIGRAHV